MKEEPTPPTSETVCTAGPRASDVNECAAIAAAEYEYWRQAPGDIGMTGTGAAANILCAINGFRAPWHPKPATATCPPPDNENAQELLRELRKAARAVVEDATPAVLCHVVSTDTIDALRAAINPDPDQGQPDKLP